jgi:hypothetical protein
VVSPFGFSPFGYSPFGISPFGLFRPAIFGPSLSDIILVGGVAYVGYKLYEGIQNQKLGITDGERSHPSGTSTAQLPSPILHAALLLFPDCTAAGRSNGGEAAGGSLLRGPLALVSPRLHLPPC